MTFTIWINLFKLYGLIYVYYKLFNIYYFLKNVSLLYIYDNKHINFENIISMLINLVTFHSSIDYYYNI